MYKIKILVMQWYIKTNKNLPIGKLFHRIAQKGVVTKDILRQFEKLVSKLAAYQQHLRYFDRCIEMNLIPEFIKFKPPDLEVYKDPSIFYKKVLHEQRRLVLTTTREIRAKYQAFLEMLRNKLNTFDFRLLLLLLHENVIKKLVLEKNITHNKKLYALWQNQRPQTPECIVNFSDRDLTLSERHALVYGLNHHILPNKINPLQIKSNIDSQINKICYFNKVNLTFDDKNMIREATDKFTHEAEKICNTKQNRHLHRTLRNLSNNNGIKICKMDKGVGLVILNENDYCRKLDNIICDRTRFTRLDYNINTNKVQDCMNSPWIVKENKIIRYCRQHLLNVVDKSTYGRIYPSGSQPGKMYGMAKNHKPNCPLRPVLSAINTAEYHLAKWLEQQIRPYLSSRFSVSSTADFVQELSGLDPLSSDVLCTFDIESLYTNVPLNEVIDSMADLIYSESAPSSFFVDSNISKTVFKNMLKTCSQSIFLYKDNVYKQHDGLSMGSPLAPLMAEWFMAGIEHQIFQNTTAYTPKFYKRYVDDIFAVFKSTADRDSFFQTLNSQHQNLKFTMEANIDQLPFLDVSVSIKGEKYQTQVYRKPTNTGVIMNYKCDAPLTWKRSLIKCLLKRAFVNSSNYKLFRIEIETLRAILKSNAYPDTFVHNIISQFLSEYGKTAEDFDMNKNDQGNRRRQLLVKEFDDVYLNIPYVGRPSSKLHHTINRRMQAHGLWVKAAYNTKKVASYFSLKSKCSSLFKANVVYQFSCSRDENKSYIGATRRQLFRRIRDHNDPKKDSAVFEHMFNCNYCKNIENISDSFKILSKGTKTNLDSLESLYIYTKRPILNNKMGPLRGCRFPLALYKD